MIRSRRSIRALSPIFAVLILIAIAVIAGIVVYMFTSGTIARLTGQGGAGSEKISIQAVEADATGNTVTFWAKSQSGGTVTIDTVILKSASGNTLEVLPLTAAPVDVTDALTAGGATTPAFTYDLQAGTSYTVTLVSTQGNQFPSQAFTAVG